MVTGLSLQLIFFADEVFCKVVFARGQMQEMKKRSYALCPGRGFESLSDFFGG